MSAAAALDRPDSALVDAVLPSPNHGERRGRSAPDAIVLHYTGMADGTSAVARLRDPAAEVSCHYVVAEDGRVLQLVAEGRRAWHAGRSFWAGDTDLNSASLGIEIVNAGHPGGLPPYPDRQLSALAALCRDLIARHAIRPERVLAHSDVAPGRKLDPGERFPWERLHAEGVGHWTPRSPGPAGPGLREGGSGPAVAALQDDLRRYGYGVEATGGFDARTEETVRAFQRHFRREGVDGIADGDTLRRLADLLDAVGQPARG